MNPINKIIQIPLTIARDIEADIPDFKGTTFEAVHHNKVIQANTQSELALLVAYEDFKLWKSFKA